MEKTEVFKILMLIESSYPSCRFRNETVEQWFRQCNALIYEDVLQHVCGHIRSRPYPPSFRDAAGFTAEGKSADWMEEYILPKEI
ncbi:hypothetical protein [Bacillus infantis]|uniref:hypothetical protein n=1 Tax=Bacillus infantis TaxID=324767 RepID=UPI0020068957|nr:hypothetical protein [Bacillus infantis]MCK6205418.1 hypothetical protein [Bacillus infantis]MCP1158600.1 hypothetical protein [Bacillus infantis]